jgi:hypothetical protein
MRFINAFLPFSHCGAGKILWWNHEQHLPLGNASPHFRKHEVPVGNPNIKKRCCNILWWKPLKLCNFLNKDWGKRKKKFLSFQNLTKWKISLFAQCTDTVCTSNTYRSWLHVMLSLHILQRMKSSSASIHGSGKPCT